MAQNRVLVTGGLGFIGTSLARLLSARGHAVRVLDNLSAQIHGHLPTIDHDAWQASGASVSRGDVVNRTDLEAALEDITHVVHLAAETGTGQSMYEIARYEHVNAYGTALLLDVLANRPHGVKKIVLSSSRSVYGEGQYRCLTHGLVQPEPRTAANLKAGIWDIHCPSCGVAVERTATAENATPNPASIYAATKLSQEQLVRIGCSSMGVPYVVLRFQNVYGPGQSLKNPYTGILSIFSTRIRRGLDLPIFEDGEESRDFVHVSDVANAVMLSLDSEGANGRTLNVGSGHPTSVREIAETLVSVFRGRSQVQVTGQYRIGDIRHCYADLTAVRAATGFEPRIGLEQGLRMFAEWVAAQPLPEDQLGRANDELKARGLMS